MAGRNIKHPIRFFFRGLLYRFVIGRLLILPFSFLVPKKKNSILFIGRDDGQFIDNVKYFFLYLNQLKPQGVSIRFLTENKDTYRRMLEMGYPVIFFPTFRSVFLLMRTALVIVDNINWIVNFKNMLLFRSRKAQLYHGVPLKQIGAFNPVLNKERQSAAIRLYQWVNGQHQVYDWFLSPSGFVTEYVFSGAYPCKYIFEGGYPRNDALFSPTTVPVFSGNDEHYYKNIKQLKETGQRIVLYMPTFRENGKGAFYDNVLSTSTLSTFAGEQHMHILVKYHQLERAKFRDSSLETNTNLSFMYDVKDIYPFLPLVDLLITDYSSIYFDFLLLGRPIVFFPYDLNTYITEERGFFLDYNEFTPGPKCFTQEELERSLLSLLVNNEDSYKDERDKLAQTVFKCRDGKSSEGIWEDIRERLLPV